MKMRDMFREWLKDARDRGHCGHDELFEEQSKAFFEHDLNHFMLILRVDFQGDPVGFGMYSPRHDETFNITRNDYNSERYVMFLYPLLVQPRMTKLANVLKMV